MSAYKIQMPGNTQKEAYNSRDYVMKLKKQGNYIKSSSYTEFLGLIIDDSLSWKARIDQMMFKLNTVCFVI